MVAVEDIAWITYQLGRAPRQMTGVGHRCASGVPMVIVTQPLPETPERASFFPTLFWLTCPVAVKAVSRLEDEGWIQRWQERLSSDPVLNAAVMQAQQTYVRLRIEQLNPEQQQHVAETQPQLWNDLSRLGIGGVAEWGTVKCLHMHLAHYWGTHENPIGQWVEEQITVHSACRVCLDAGKAHHAGVAK